MLFEYIFRFDVQYFHYNAVLLVSGIQHFCFVIWTSFSFSVPLHYHLCFNKWNEEPFKVSEKEHPTHTLIQQRFIEHKLNAK